MPTIALVLGAGGVTGGAFHAGVLSALVEATGWDPRTAELMVGTSAGSATAAVLRAGLSAPDLAARAERAPLSPEGTALLRSAGAPTGPPPVPDGPRLRFGRPAAPEILVGALRRPWQVRPAALMAGLLPAGTVPTGAIADGMNALHGNGWPAKPTWLCAVRLHDASLVAFGRDDAPVVSIGDAVAASCAIPGFFKPAEIDGERYVDGGVHSLTNVGEAALVKPDLVIVSSPMSRAGSGRYSAGSAIRQVGRAQLAVEVQRLRRRGIAVVTFQPTADDERAMGLNAMDPSRRADVVRQVHVSASARIDAVRDRLSLLG